MDLKSLVNENQSIKIVPSIEDIVRQNGFNTDLDTNTLTRFNNVKVIWQTWKRGAAVKNELFEIFNMAMDPFTVSLIMVVKCEDFKDCKPKTLSYCIIEEMNSWNKSHKKAPTIDIKLMAFNIATQQRNQDFMNLIVKSFDVVTEKSAIIPLIDKMIKQGAYKQALQSVMSLGIYDDIPVEELLFPLVLQDKGSMVDNYLMQCPQEAKKFIFYIDNLLDRKINIRDAIQNYVSDHNITDVKWDKLYHKPLGKLVARLCAKFKVPLQDCKNLSKNRTTGGLKYLIIQKYQEKNVSDSSWNDLVKDSIEHNPEAAINFVDMLIEYDVREALKWAEHFQLPLSTYPSILLELKSNRNSICDPKPVDEENWDDECGPSREFYQLTLSKNKICVIDNIITFRNLIEDTLKKLQFLGIDCEWKPCFGASQSKVALIQVATPENVFLIDLAVMSTLECTNVWQMFISKIIENPEIIKIGFGVEHDIKEMRSTFLSLFNLKMKGEGFLDIGDFSKCLIKAGLELPHRTETSGGSLSCLTQACFGLPLMKHEQCSNWEVRPLRQSQIDYASLDAYVLIDIYVLLQNLCKKQSIKFAEICYDVMEKVKNKNVKKIKTKLTNKTVKMLDMNKPGDTIKFMVEYNLFPLVKHFRFCGFDTTVLEKDTLWHHAVNEAVSEERYIVLSKMKHTPTVYYPQKHILVALKGGVNEQLLNILSIFDINIPPENFYKRCVLCNSTNITTMTSGDVRERYHQYSVNKINLSREHDSCRNDELDGFLSDAESDEELYQTVSVNKSSEKSDIWLTKEEATVDIAEICHLPTDYEGPIFLCEGCGKLYWHGNHPVGNADNLISELPLC